MARPLLSAVISQFLIEVAGAVVECLDRELGRVIAVVVVLPLLRRGRADFAERFLALDAVNARPFLGAVVRRIADARRFLKAP